ncbi:hypothetical protein QBC47DRAFT_389474 [Echria macrotheca]|uniref:Uncharacterized protein n=1 Tax=Echria macrotheca TaxID=438768 RepID=A0AAJ0F8E0_9PEZI|nr:hypothetical protein QBC47DRAFT_389474 [Echria macrotheca]
MAEKSTQGKAAPHIQLPNTIGCSRWTRGDDGSFNAFTTPSWISSATLKKQLDTHYAGQYSVRLKQDVFKISIRP